MRAPLWRIKRLAIPALGCDEGGLAWADVHPLILSAARRLFGVGEVVAVEPEPERRRDLLC